MVIEVICQGMVGGGGGRGVRGTPHIGLYVEGALERGTSFRLEVCSHVKDRIVVESDTFLPFKNVVSVSDISAVIEFDCRMEVVCL